MSNPVDYQDLMTTFRHAYTTADPALLGEVLGPGFEWHTHTFPADDPTPTGRVLRGIDEMVAELHWRNENWTDVKFEDLREQFAPQLVTQTFTISGFDRGTRFHVNAVDLYTLDDQERIIRKATYWKQPAS